ncbi:MAG: PP2C family protein-serine/threonine phosphatase, partial [Cyanobacteria bacterium NC_groundwater_1444_Ag_S-0.65um_54_12]|nr:PP2C family protein-serine/threonine phosphatase [Cyanobacteria bacterium NC_groundwater_1444_Ag_S-0.65um_54_12]
RGQYDIGEVIERFARLTDETLEASTLFEHYCNLAAETVRPRYLTISVHDRHKGSFKFKATRNLEENALSNQFPAFVQQEEQVESIAERSDCPTVLQVPLVWQRELIGQVNLGPKRSEEEYSFRDRQLLTAMAHRLADKLRIAAMLRVAIAKARLDQELSTAQAIHSAMLPANLPQIPGIEITGSSKPAAEFGGDYYELFPLPDGRLALAIGDVVGKGVQAAMVMAMTKACLSTLVNINPAIAVVMSELNRMICETIPDRTYRKTTFCYAILDRSAGQLTYACAGHPPPLLFNSVSGGCKTLKAPGSFPLGTTHRAQYQQLAIKLGPGDGLVLFTDGITEARSPSGRYFYDVIKHPDGRELEIDELADTVAAHASQPVASIRDAVMQRLQLFTGNREITDDITLLVLRWLQPIEQLLKQ